MQKKIFRISDLQRLASLFMSNASINVKPEGSGGGGGGGPWAYVGHLTFQKNFWSKIPTVGPQNWVKSDQISPPFPSIYIENE